MGFLLRISCCCCYHENTGIMDMSCSEHQWYASWIHHDRLICDWQLLYDGIQMRIYHKYRIASSIHHKCICITTWAPEGRERRSSPRLLNFNISLNIFVFEACQEWQIKYPALVTVRDDVSCGGNVGGDQSLEGHYPQYYPPPLAPLVS